MPPVILKDRTLEKLQDLFEYYYLETKPPKGIIGEIHDLMIELDPIRTEEFINRMIEKRINKRYK